MEYFNISIFHCHFALCILIFAFTLLLTAYHFTTALGGYKTRPYKPLYRLPLTANNRGFTQAELLIAMAMFVILLGVAVGRFSKSTLIGLDVESYANKIASDLRLTARLSQVNSQRYDMEFYGKGGATDTNYTYYKIKNYDTGEYYTYTKEYADGSVYFSNDIVCTPLGTGVSAVQTISFYTEGYARMLTSAGVDIVDTTKNGVTCNAAAGKQSISFANITVTLETSLVKVDIKRAGQSQ